MAEMDHLGAGALQDATHDVDGRVVTVEQRGRSDEAHLVLGLVWLERRGDGKIGHDGIHFRRGREARTERSEEHTSELQSLLRISYAVFCLKNKHYITHRRNATA